MTFLGFENVALSMVVTLSMVVGDLQQGDKKGHSLNHLVHITYLGGGFKISPLPEEMIQFDEHIFQRGWNHHLDVYQ